MICSTCDVHKDESEFHKGKRSCKPCIRARNSTWAKTNPDKMRAIRARNRESKNAAARASYGEHIRAKNRAWHRENVGIRLALNAKRRAAVNRATLAGLTPLQCKQIVEVYTKAYRANLVVDHVVPLHGLYVCGLHVPWNLEAIPQGANDAKGNYHESEEAWR